ncbi:HAD hydrolase, family IA [Propionibacterium sp. oral taxon 192 str. F0372]|nr:HAD hydrolase, family IA [Propionibacterium sp. oral taxon 192 str. F0372]
MVGNIPEAVLWDFDGTLVNSEVVWVDAEIELFSSFGITWTREQGVEYCGSSREVSTAAFLAWAESQGRPLPISGEEFYERMHRMVRDHLSTVASLPWLPGAEQLVLDLLDNGIPQAIVSASPLDLIMAGVDRMPSGAFSLVVPGSEIPRGKPEPDGYLLAAERLGVDPGRCVVIEDSAYGTQAGINAGAAVIAVPCMKPLPHREYQLNLPSLTGLDTASLGRIWKQLRGDK